MSFPSPAQQGGWNEGSFSRTGAHTGSSVPREPVGHGGGSRVLASPPSCSMHMAGQV